MFVNIDEVLILNVPVSECDKRSYIINHSVMNGFLRALRASHYLYLVQAYELNYRTIESSILQWLGINLHSEMLATCTEWNSVVLDLERQGT